MYCSTSALSLVAAVGVVFLAGAADATPILGVPAYTFEDSAVSPEAPGDKDYTYLVVTTASPRSDDVVPLDSPRERSRFLVTLLMLESLRDQPGAMDPKLKAQLVADEQVMQEVLKFYETQQETKGKHYIKIPPKLLKKMKKKMKELLSE